MPCRVVSAAERLGSLEVDHQLELDRGLDGKFARLRVPEDAISIRRRAAVIIAEIISIGQQPANFSEETARIDSRETEASDQRNNLRAMDGQEGIRHHYQATIWVASQRRNDGFKLGHVAHGRDDRFHRKGHSGSFEGFQVVFRIGRGCGVEQEGDPVDARRNLLEQLKPFAGHGRLHQDKAGDVAARPLKARDEAAADRIDNVYENNGDGARLLQQSRCSGRALRNNKVGLQRN